MTSGPRTTLAGIATLAVTVGCYSGLDARAEGGPAASGSDLAGTEDGGRDESAGDAADDPEHGRHFAVSGLRRLSPAEYDATVADLLGFIARPSEGVLPTDSPLDEEDWAFDNNYESQVVGAALVDAVQALAEEAAGLLVANSTRVAEVVGCTPSGPGDEACMRSFVERFGRRAYRRPLTNAEVERFMALQRCPPDASDPDACGFAEEQGDFYAAVDAVVQAFLVNPNFLYRVEEGVLLDTADDVFRLGDFEVATRLSYLLWGRGPDDWLLDIADAGGLSAVDDVRAVTAAMLGTEAARAQIGRFHAQWLGYERLPFDPALAAGMAAESQALLDRVVFEDKSPWVELLLARETFVDSTLAEHYGLSHPGTPGPSWVDYGDSGRLGIFSHGGFLFGGQTGSVTSPVMRGHRVVTKVLCTSIPPPPPNVPAPDPMINCKADMLAEHATGGCAGCHEYMDPIGFGLETYDLTGRYRDAEPGKPECTLSGEGALPPIGTLPETTSFHGPAGLAELVVDAELIQPCVALQLARYGLGRNIGAGEPVRHPEDIPFAQDLAKNFGADGRFDALVLELVTSDSFLHRRIAPEEPE